MASPLPTTSSSVSVSWSNLAKELYLNIATFLPVEDLCRFQCINKEIAYEINTESIWEDRCKQRWASWPRYELTAARKQEMNSDPTSRHYRMNWKQRYHDIEREATRTTLQLRDLHKLNWYLCFVLSGIRGEGRSDHYHIEFTLGDILLVPNYPPLRYQLINEPPPTTSSHIRSNIRGDRPFSTTQYLQINDFPPHFISRKQSDAEWLIVNENVMMVSRGEM